MSLVVGTDERGKGSLAWSGSARIQPICGLTASLSKIAGESAAVRAGRIGFMTIGLRCGVAAAAILGVVLIAGAAMAQGARSGAVQLVAGHAL